MNLMKLGTKKAIFTSVCIIITTLFMLIILPMSENLHLFVTIFNIIAMYLSGGLSKLLFQSQRNEKIHIFCCLFFLKDIL